VAGATAAALAVSGSALAAPLAAAAAGHHRGRHHDPAPPSEPSAFEAMALAPLLASDTRHDVRDAEALRATLARTEPELVFHLAAQPLVRQSYLEPAETFETNVMGTLHLLEALRLRARPCTVVVVTSDKCYAERATPHGHTETDPLGGHDAYAASKAAAEIVTASYRASFFPPARVAEHGIAIATARAGNVIGGGDWGRYRLVPDTIRSLAAGEVVAIRAPEAVRPWQHVLEPLGGYLTLAARLDDRADPARGRFATGYNFGPSSEAARPVRHVVSALVSAWGAGHWQAVRELDGPRLVHVITQKGKGFPAGEHAGGEKWHALPPGHDPSTGKQRT